MGVAVLGQCYADLASAAQAVCSAYPHQAVTASGSLVTYRCTGVMSNAQMSVTRAERLPDGTPVNSVTSVAVAGPECDPSERVLDTVELWGLMVALCAVIWAGKQVYAIFNNVRGES